MIGHTMLLHNTQELDDDLGARADQDLAFSGLVCIVDGVERVVENGDADHIDETIGRYSNLDQSAIW